MYNWSTMRLKDQTADQWNFCPKSKQYQRAWWIQPAWSFVTQHAAEPSFCKDSRTGRSSGVEDLMQLVRFQNRVKFCWHLLQHSLLFWSKKRIAQVICLQLRNSINIGTSPLSCWSVKLVDNTTERSNRWSVDLLSEKHRISVCLINSDGLKLRDTAFSWNPACKDSRTGPFPELKTLHVCFASKKWGQNSAIVGWHLFQHCLMIWPERRIAQVTYL